MVREELLLTTADQPQLQLTTDLLDGSNWTSWKIAVETALNIKVKDCFIDGTLPSPPKNDPSFKLWKRVDNLVLTWLRNSISPDLARRFVHNNTAFSLWTDLNESYGKVSGPQIIVLKRRIANFTQASRSVTTYFTDLKMTWSDFRMLKPFDTDNPELLKLLIKEDDSDFLIQFLMGLNDEYTHIGNQILIMNPLPSANAAYGMIHSVETKGAQENLGNDSATSFALAVTDRNSGERKNGVMCSYCKKIGHTREKCYQLANKTAICDHCKKTGHVKANCFQLTGVVPEWYKNMADKRKGKSVVAAAYSTSNTESDSNGSKSGAETSVTSSSDARMQKLEEMILSSNALIKELVRAQSGANLSHPLDYAGGAFEVGGGAFEFAGTDI